MKRVCVTGATGFIARFVIDQLLQRGYEVVGTVRSLNQRDKMEYLEYLQSKYENRLKICEADLFDTEALDKAIQGCHGVFHIAAPYKFMPPDTPDEVARKELVDPAVIGTENVLKLCAKHKDDVSKVIYMTSVFAMLNSYVSDTPAVVNENSWNSDKSILDAGDPYHYSKTVSEKRAWEIFEKELKPLGIDMVSVAPVYVLGPVVPDTETDLLKKLGGNESLLNEGIGIFVDFFKGKSETCYDMTIGLVDVRDVASVFVKAYELDTATSPDRYICSQSEMRFIEVCDILRKMYPQYSDKFPRKTTLVGDEKPGTFKCDVHLVRDKLGIQWKPLDTTIRDMYDSFTSLGYIGEATSSS
jgi:nucleoside-diphosphate-sugar epimerase